MGKKQQTESVNSKLALVMKSGKAVLGYKQTFKALRKGALKAIFVAHNTPSIVKAQQIIIVFFQILLYILMLEIILILAQHAVNIIEYPF